VNRIIEQIEPLS